ncbi:MULTISPECIES: methionyl-tRNA formyltransferase [Bacteroidaceae]|uniref:Methionyl-tRNA formyltransferase n=1 Tax=Phocaeicola faecium TaxID=2762213 RepID=A0ABR8VA28_9BACT|nr:MULTISPECIES: methionyl-tRNA formyltransferase [Bacteroidaceae]MBD8001623.1 methionyl-tRNA formyltransferase [Phocaeicola faecium]MCL1625458.1 methionyl-tRNA formyltransferase [Bacteroides caecicola]
MEKKDLRIVYMGTPEFAVESLKRLVEGGYNIVGVITMPDKPMGRHGSVLQPSPVKQYAVSQGLKVLQPEKLKDESFVAELRELKADLQIVVAFRMLPEVVWNMPRLGTFNLHASLLPQYRGAAPINWAVINGETETGITTFFLKHEIDTGEIIDQVRVPIADTDNVGDVYERLMNLGGDLVVKTVDSILDGSVKTVPQDKLAEGEVLRPAPKIFKETCRIDWSKGVKQIYDFVRGLSPYPAAWTELCQGSTAPQVLKIYETDKIFAEHSFEPGAVVTDKKTYFRIAVTDGYINIRSLQLAGKKRMGVADFLRGYHHEDGAVVK